MTLSMSLVLSLIMRRLFPFVTLRRIAVLLREGDCVGFAVLGGVVAVVEKMTDLMKNHIFKAKNTYGFLCPMAFPKVFLFIPNPLGSTSGQAVFESRKYICIIFLDS